MNIASHRKHFNTNPLQYKTQSYMRDVEAKLSTYEATHTSDQKMPVGAQSSERLNGMHGSPNPNGQEPQSESLITEDSFWQEIGKSIYRDKKALVGTVVVVLFIIIALLAPFIAPYDPYEASMSEMLQKPVFMLTSEEASSATHTYLLGTDFLGRDVLSRIIYGARISLMIGLVPTLITLMIGSFMGIAAGYFGGKIDYGIMRLADVCMSFPSLLLAMVVMYTLGASLFNIFIALSVVNWGGTSRIVRAQTLSIKEKEYVEAARATGVGSFHIMWRHILPNCIPNLIVLFSLSVPEAIMSEAGLSFLGVGAQPPMPSWGLMISRGKEYLFSSPWIAITPGIAIFIVVIAFNFIGDGLRDALDPYTKHD